MKKVVGLLLVVAMLCAVTSVFAEGVDPKTPLMTIQGNARVAVEADTVSIQLGVQTKAERLRDAQKENAERMEAVMSALKACGVEDKDIMTSNFNIYQSYDYESEAYTDSYRQPRTQLYYVDNTLTVTLHNIDIAGEVLDAAISAGANTMYGISFTSSRANEAYLLALKRAVEDAKGKAEVLAEAAGVSLGQLIEIQASPNYSAYRADTYAKNSVAMSADDAGTSIVGGDLSVDATVTLVFSYN
jgi:uncharacterized protein YggE